MARQKIQFTVMPRGISLDAATAPVSVYVSPRLYEDDRLGAFPDWLTWTRNLQDQGLALTFRAGARTLTLPVDTAPLRPDLWEQMFNAKTFVRSHTFDDYTRRAIFTYPLRYALSMIKTIYQKAGVVLALPDRGEGDDERQGGSQNRRLLNGLLTGLQENWDDKLGLRWRNELRDLGVEHLASFYAPLYTQDNIGADGTFNPIPPDADLPYRKQMLMQHAVFRHIPPGKSLKDNPPDFDKLIDFHQALSSLNSYPALLRALGLVFDFDLPDKFVDPAPSDLGRLGVSDVPKHAWRLGHTEVPPQLPIWETAYVYLRDSAHHTRWFATAPSVLGDAAPELESFGLLNLDPLRYGLAQVDVDGSLHKNIILAETWQKGQSPAPGDHPEVFDPSATLPALRSGGLSLFADGRALKLLTTFQQQKEFDDAFEKNQPTKRPFYAEDLIHGYRLDIWDSLTLKWHSLHWRKSKYDIGALSFEPNEKGKKPGEEEGFTQLAATQAAPDPAKPTPDDLYLHEAVARWAGWSLSVPMPGKPLSSDPDPDKALHNPNPNEPATPFKMQTHYHPVKGSLPALRFGRRYRLRARVVDICGNSLGLDEPVTDFLTGLGFALPPDPEGFVYLRYEPVTAPVLVVRDEHALTDPGSQIDRLVIRTYNADPSKDSLAADLTGNERHLVPPRTSVELAERLGMFDDPSGKLVDSQPMYDLISARDKGDLPQVDITVSGKKQSFPLIAGDRVAIPYLPDVLSRGAAFRDLPGAPEASVGSVDNPDDPTGKVKYTLLGDPNPRPGSATLVSFGGADDWTKMASFRLALDESGPALRAPEWDGSTHKLTVFLPKGTTTVTALSSYMQTDDLKRMGVWQWLREFIDRITVDQPAVDFLQVGAPLDAIDHILQRTVEGGHWMLNPPRLVTLVHAVQQPLGAPAFAEITVQHQPYGDPSRYPYDETVNPDSTVLQTEPEKAPTAETELAPITAWRKPGSIEAFLMGGLAVHAASTSRVDLHAEWQDPVDDISKPRHNGDNNVESHSGQVDTIPLNSTTGGLIATGPDLNARQVAYYVPGRDLLCFVRNGDELGNLPSHEPSWDQTIDVDAAPRHHLNDTRHHRITYTAISTSRFVDYFPADQAGGFTRTSAPVIVDVPASTRPDAPQIAYIVPTFGWQRQTQTNLKRSVRFGGGLRVYLERPWFSSGEGELLGVTTFDYLSNSSFDRDRWKSYATQWGGDPIWKTPGLNRLPQTENFPDAEATQVALSLDAPAPGRVNVAGFPVEFDEERQLWFADLTINTESLTYAPFVRLALVRYQPHALPDAMLSRVVIADFAQLTPERSAIVTADPYHSHRLSVTVSGVAPKGPLPEIVGGQTDDQVNKPTLITVTVQQREPSIQGELGWVDVPDGVATIADLTGSAKSDLIRWTGTVDFVNAVEPGKYRILIREFEYISANYVVTEPAPPNARPHHFHPKRLIYAETMQVDSALISGPTSNTGTTLD